MDVKFLAGNFAEAQLLWDAAVSGLLRRFSPRPPNLTETTLAENQPPPQAQQMAALPPCGL